MTIQFPPNTIIGQSLCIPTDINVEDIRPLLLALAEHLDVVLWRDTNTTTHKTEFSIIPRTRK